MLAEPPASTPPAPPAHAALRGDCAAASPPKPLIDACDGANGNEEARGTLLGDLQPLICTAVHSLSAARASATESSAGTN
jgi:hypothetical protein